MDPNATLQQLIYSAEDGDYESVLEYAEYLADWLRKGGFPPKRPDDAAGNVDPIVLDSY